MDVNKDGFMDIDDILGELEENEKKNDRKHNTTGASKLNLNTANLAQTIEDAESQNEERKAKVPKTEAPMLMDLTKMIDDTKKQEQEQKARVEEKTRTQALKLEDVINRLKGQTTVAKVSTLGE